MNFEESLVWWLVADAGLQRLVAGRYFPGIPKQGTVGPYLVYRLQDEQGGRFLARRHDTVRVDYMLEVWDTDPDRCGTVAALVVDRLDDTLGWMGGVKVKSLKAEQAGSDEQQDDSGNDAWWYRRRIRLEAAYDKFRGPPVHGPTAATKGQSPATSTAGINHGV